MYVEAPDKFGWAPSHAAIRSASIFSRADVARALELGCGAGRDALHLAGLGFEIDAIDYASAAVEGCRKRARDLGLGDRIDARVHDVRDRLPFEDDRFDGVFAHMLHNMALGDDDLVAIFAETQRVLRPGGLLVFSVRNTTDPDADTGIALTPFLRDVDGDVIRFFSRECIAQFARDFDVLGIVDFEEGALPKRLSLVTARKR